MTQGKRIFAYLGEGLLALVALALLLTGLTLLAMTDDRGRFTVEEEDFSAEGDVLVGDSWDESVYRVGGVIESSEVRVELDGGSPLFAGFAAKEDVERFLEGTAHTLVHRATNAQGPTSEAVAGAKLAEDPAQADIWVASVEGQGPQSLVLDAAGLEGEYVPVVVNLEGGDSTSGSLATYYEVPFLGTVTWSLIGVGLVGLAGSVWLVVRTRRKAVSAA
ncbi:hypothetical protein [Salininema proteolyticum]|uniref:Secreted protein n=1 Tax=Salininema proteolyticum TaxID=1607685 RepID=A0ABV8U3N1_9ACTN